MRLRQLATTAATLAIAGGAGLGIAPAAQAQPPAPPGDLINGLIDRFGTIEYYPFHGIVRSPGTGFKTCIVPAYCPNPINSDGSNAAPDDVRWRSVTQVWRWRNGTLTVLEYGGPRGKTPVVIVHKPVVVQGGGGGGSTGGGGGYIGSSGSFGGTGGTGGKVEIGELENPDKETE